MREFAIVDAEAILRRTPGVLQSLLADLPDVWLHESDGPGRWTPAEVLVHLIEAERALWVPRMDAILRAPFGGRTARETLEQVRRDEPPPLCRFNREITPNLEAFCLRCLRKNPWRRFSRTYDVLKKLREFQANPESPPGERGIPRPPLTGE